MTALNWYVHMVTVETYEGSGAYGPAYTTAEQVRCWLEDGNKLVRDSEGNEVVSSTELFVPLAQASLFTVGSRVTLPSGRTASVLSAATFDSGSLNLGLDHAEVALT